LRLGRNLKDEGKINSEQRSVIDKEIDELKDKRSSLQTEEGVLSQSISKMEAEARRLFNIGGQCPVCRQKVTKLHIKNTTGDLRTSIKKSSALLNDLQVSISSLTKAINKKKDSVMVLAQEHTRIAEKYQATVSKLSDLKSAIASTTAESNSLIKEINSLKNGQNPHKETIRESKDRIERLKDEIHKLKGEMSTLEEAHEIASFWVNGFKKVRLLVIEDTLQQLEVETNNNLVQLGLIGWSVRFDIERENKSGGLTSGFTVMINSPEYNEPVKWEAWSGGEKQRLRLAGALGLSNLIMDRAGLTSRIEFYDELSRHLSPEGIDDMLDTLCQRASDFGRKIWLVDHQSHDFGDFAGKLTITKTDAGSQLHFECGQQ
jgi:DNA repair exonuclease SbcCD ATPase subunit